MDPPPFEDVVERHYADLYRFALSLTRNEADASDLVQHVFVIYTTRGGQIRDVEKIKGWLFTTLYREFLRLRARNQRYVHLGENNPELTEASSASHSGCATNQGNLLEALASLDETHRSVLALFYLDQHSYKEIAAILDIPMDTVMSRLSRAKEALRRKLDDHSPPE